ncbi:MAG: hypothetical protein MUF04_11260, partial [Akkermansiaceae bacterium]|nr:hypothetical protein [Akkermansiaceae bacterium]
MKIHPTLSAGAAPSCRTVGRLQLGAPTRRGGRPSNLLRNGIWMLALLATGAARGQVYEKLFSFTDANSTAQGTVLTRGSLIESA